MANTFSHFAAIVETSERSLSEVRNDEVSPEIYRTLLPHRGLQAVRSVSGRRRSGGSDLGESSSEAVLAKTVRQLQRDTVRDNKTRFLEFHRSVQEAAKANSKLKKFGEILRIKRQKIIEQRIKDKARRSELGLEKVKMPKRHFFKISQPMQCFIRKPVSQLSVFKNHCKNENDALSVNRLSKSEKLQLKGVVAANHAKFESSTHHFSDPVLPAMNLSYSRFLYRNLEELGSSREKTCYLPIQMYDRPPHEMVNLSRPQFYAFNRKK